MNMCITMALCLGPCRRGTLLSTAIFLYAATSPVNGYFGGALYSRMGGMLLSVSGVLSADNIENSHLRYARNASFSWRRSHMGDFHV